ncbi:MAG: methylmalonate-semialdehyde dehydrogenase (CoA acylating), partial [Halomonas sp.]|nr:methylmalonate-semialdehyde dehydrogenase (CoA acylating) [Halomonas sp.]
MSVREIPMIIDGQAVPSQSSEWRDVINPATQEVVARVPFCTLEEVDRAVASAHQAFASWRKVPLAKRMRIMLKLQALIREHTPELAALITEEHGKTLPDAEGEVGRGLEVVEHACS